MTTHIIRAPGYTGPERRQTISLTDSQFGRIVDAVTDSDRMRAMDSRFDVVEQALFLGGERMGRIEDKLDANTETTREVRELLETGRALFRFASGFGRFARWLAGLIAAGVAIYGAWHNSTGGKPPGV